MSTQGRMKDDRPNVPVSRLASGATVSRLAFGGMLGISLAACFTAGLPLQAGYGITFTLAGLLMVLCPPQVRAPWPFLVLAGLLLVTAAGAFLPLTWFGVSDWRSDLEALGLRLGGLVTPNPWLTLEFVTGMAFALAGVVYVLGHRLGDREFPWLALCFAAGVAVYAGVSIFAVHALEGTKEGSEAVFGFFPNRNHTATLLVMGCLTAGGLLWHGVRHARGGMASGAAVCLLVCLWALLGYNISRAGVMLLGAGVMVWWVGLGRAYFTKWVLAVLGVLMLGLGWIWMNSSSQLKERIQETVDRVAASAGTESAPAEVVSSGTDPSVLTAPSFDLRLLIYRDAWEMVKAEPWTGVGFGNFHLVFPQYRRLSSSEYICLHPEGDWWWLAAELGLLAPLLLAGGVIGLAWLVLKRGKGLWLWMGRMSCLSAALVVPLHGVFDVPGHRIGLMWASAVLAAMALRPSPQDRPAGGLMRWSFRVFGAAILLAGGWLLWAEWGSGKPVALAQPGRHLDRAMALYAEEMEAVKKAATSPPLPAAEEPAAAAPAEEDDRLYLALESVEEAVKGQPLAAYPHYLHGALALYFEGYEQVADEALALHLRLEPLRPEVALHQATLLVPVHPGKVPPLWDEALNRRDRLAAVAPSDRYAASNTVFHAIFAQARQNETLAVRALELIGRAPEGGRFNLFEQWCRAMPRDVLDDRMPGLLLMETHTPAQRTRLWKIWESRGTKGQAGAFAGQYPDLLEPAPSPVEK